MEFIPLAIVIFYIGMLYLVSWYSTKLSKNGGSEGYLLAGRGFPASVVAVMLAGLAIGGASTIGVAENAYKTGMSAGMYNAAWAVGGILVGLIAAAKYRNMTISTVPELFERYYSTSGRVIGVIGQIIIQITITSLQYIAGGAILTALLPEVFTMATGMLTTAVVFVGITLIGGMWAAGLSNIINVSIIYLGILIGGISAVTKYGGFSEISLALPQGDHWFDPISGVGIGVVAAWFAVMVTQAFSTQAVVQISFAAKNEKAARNGFLLGGLIILPIGFLAAIFGIVAAAQFPGIEAAAALPSVILTLNPIIAGFTLAALWAADVSTASALLLGSSTLVVQDIWKRYFKPDMTEKQSIFASRVTVLGVSVLTYLLAASVTGILKTLTLGLTLTTSYTLVLLFTMFAPKFARKSSAFWTVFVGVIYLLVWYFVPAIHIVPHAIYLAWPVSLVTFFAVYFLDKRPAQIPANFASSDSSSTTM